jgi:hypothetical protein
MPQRHAVRPHGRIELVLAEFRPKHSLARTRPERVTELFCLARLLTPNVASFTYRGIRRWKTLRPSLHLRLLMTMGVLRHMATEGMALVDG